MYEIIGIIIAILVIYYLAKISIKILKFVILLGIIGSIIWFIFIR